MSMDEAETELESLKSQVKEDEGFMKQTKISLADKTKNGRKERISVRLI